MKRLCFCVLFPLPLARRLMFPTNKASGLCSISLERIARLRRAARILEREASLHRSKSLSCSADALEASNEGVLVIILGPKVEAVVSRVMPALGS